MRKGNLILRNARLRLLGVCLCFIYILVCFLFVVPLLPKVQGLNNPNRFKGVLTLWQVETFEGGSTNRTTWLNNQALAFEKVNKGVYISIMTLTYAQMNDKLLNGDKFDLISFGVGVGEDILSRLTDFDGKLNQLQFLTGGRYNGKQLALPYMYGGYGLFSLSGTTDKASGYVDDLTSVFDSSYTFKKQSSTVTVPSFNVGFAQFNQPLVALRLNTSAVIKQPNSALINEKTTQYDAYTNLTANRVSTFTLGTQRDNVRLDNRVSANSLAPYKYTPLAKFTDLVQYIAMSGNNEEVCSDFMEYLISEPSQKTLVKVGMFSPLLKLYTNGNFGLLEKSLANAQTINCFTSKQRIEELRKLSIASMSNGKTFEGFLC